MILQLYTTNKHCWHSLSFTLAKPTPLREKTLLFSLVKNFINDLWLVICLFLMCRKPSDLSEFVQSIANLFFFSKLAYISVYICLVQFYPWFKFSFLLSLGIVIHDNRFETKEIKFEPRIKWTTTSYVISQHINTHISKSLVLVKL